MTCGEAWGGVPAAPEEPPHPIATRARARTIIRSTGRSLPRILRRWLATPTQQNTLSTILPIGDVLSWVVGVAIATTSGATLTVSVTEEGLEPFRVILAGLNA